MGFEVAVEFEEFGKQGEDEGEGYLVIGLVRKVYALPCGRSRSNPPVLEAMI